MGSRFQTPNSSTARLSITWKNRTCNPTGLCSTVEDVSVMQGDDMVAGGRFSSTVDVAAVRADAAVNVNNVATLSPMQGWLPQPACLRQWACIRSSSRKQLGTARPV